MRRPLGVAGCALTIAVLTGGCGLLPAEADPAGPAPTSASPSSPGTGGPTVASPASGDTVTAELAGSADGRPASVEVSVSSARTCRPTSEAVYALVSIVLTDHSPPDRASRVASNFRLDVGVTGGAEGVVMAPDSACGDLADLARTTTLQTQNLADEHQSFTVYVAARPSPESPDPLRGATLELRDLRHQPDDVDSGTWTWTITQVTPGSACPDDPEAVCVPVA